MDYVDFNRPKGGVFHIILRYVQDADLRHRIQRQLNRGGFGISWRAASFRQSGGISDGEL